MPLSERQSFSVKGNPDHSNSFLIFPFHYLGLEINLNFGFGLLTGKVYVLGNEKKVISCVLCQHEKKYCPRGTYFELLFPACSLGQLLRNPPQCHSQQFYFKHARTHTHKHKRARTHAHARMHTHARTLSIIWTYMLPSQISRGCLVEKTSLHHSLGLLRTISCPSGSFFLILNIYIPVFTKRKRIPLKMFVFQITLSFKLLYLLHRGKHVCTDDTKRVV